MATAGDGRAPYESRGDGEKSRKRPFQSEIIAEEPQNFPQGTGQNNSSGVSDHGANSASIFATIGISELEQILKQKTFTRSGTRRLTSLLYSRTCDNVVAETSLPITPMASPQHPATIEDLPGDLLYKIFIHLKAKQLAQMRCVSKSWNALLSESSFIKSHLHHSINNNDRILLVSYYNESNSTDKLVIAYPCRPPHLELTNFIKPPHATNGSGRTYHLIKFIGSVHGLICSSYDNDVIHIWNPSLSAVSTLPPYRIPRRDCNESYFRFGFDPKTEDYKVVKITGLRGPLIEQQTSYERSYVPSFPYVIKKWLLVEIYSMRKGSWKLITHRVPSHITRIFNRDEVCVDGRDGRIHWVGHTNEKVDSEVIVAFDLGTETFREMTLPYSVLDYFRTNTLGVLGGKPCVMSRDGKGGIDVWVMEEYGVAESWVKRHAFRFLHRCDSLTGFTSHDEFLVEDFIHRLFLYNQIADEAKILAKGCCNELFCLDKIVEYVDSLVWVAPSSLR